MNTDTTDKVLDALKPIAEKLSTTVDLLMAKYAVYIRTDYTPMGGGALLPGSHRLRHPILVL